MQAAAGHTIGEREPTHAIVREVPATFPHAIPPEGSETKPASGTILEIDVALARDQHRRYCEALCELGLELIPLAADDRHPDCAFVEDTALVVEDLAIIPVMGASSRRGESKVVAEVLGSRKTLHYLRPPATLDGGDVLQVGRRIFIGRSRRTNAAAIEQLVDLLAPYDYEVLSVPVDGVLHLKAGVTRLDDERVLLRPGVLDETPLAGLRKVAVPSGEPHAANCISVGETVLVADRAPVTAANLRSDGFGVLEVDMSEFRKAGGLLTCCSILFTG